MRLLGAYKYPSVGLCRALHTFTRARPAFPQNIKKSHKRFNSASHPHPQQAFRVERSPMDLVERYAGAVKAGARGDLGTG